MGGGFRSARRGGGGRALSAAVAIIVLIRRVSSLDWRQSRGKGDAAVIAFAEARRVRGGAVVVVLVYGIVVAGVIISVGKKGY